MSASKSAGKYRQKKVEFRKLFASSRSSLDSASPVYRLLSGTTFLYYAPNQVRIQIGRPVATKKVEFRKLFASSRNSLDSASPVYRLLSGTTFPYYAPNRVRIQIGRPVAQKKSRISGVIRMAPGKNRVKISPGDGVKTWHAKYIRMYIECIRGLSHPPFLKSGQPGPWLARAGVPELPHRHTQVRRAPPPRREADAVACITRHLPGLGRHLASSPEHLSSMRIY